MTMDYQTSHSDATSATPSAAASTAASDSMRAEALSSGNQTNDSQRSLSDQTIKQSADAVRDALGVDKYFGLGAVDKDKVIAIISTMNTADKQALEDAYDSKYGADGTDLQQIINERMTQKDFFDIPHDYGADATLSVLQRSSPDPQFSQRIQNVLDRVEASPQDGGAEKDLLSILSVMNSQDTKTLIGSFTNGGTDASFITNNASISEKTRAVAAVYLKGVDKVTDDDLVKLADMALDKKDNSLFNQLMARTSQAARDSYSALSLVPARIKNQFYWADQDLSLDYLQTGHAGLTNLVKENTHWLHENKSAIVLAIDNATPEERQMYATGRKWEQEKVSPASAQDQAAVAFYKSLHDAFKSAAYDWEVQGWESRLINNSDSTLIETIAKTHHDGLLGSAIGSGTNTDQLFNTLNNMDAEDWSKLTGLTVDGKPLPDGKAVSDAFKTDLNSEIDALGLNIGDRNTARAIIDAKAKAANFSESNKTDDILKVQASYAGFLGIGRDSDKLMDGLVKISEAQQNQYRQDPDFKSKVDAYVGQLDDGAQKILGSRILEKLSNVSAETPLALDSLDLLLLHSLDKNNHAVSIVEEMEKTCQTDANARSALANGTDIQGALQTQLADAITRQEHQGLASIVAVSEDERRDALSKAKTIVDDIVQSGFAPIQTVLSLTGDQALQFQVLLSASPGETSKILDNSPDSHKDIEDAVGDKTFALAQNILRAQSDEKKGDSSTSNSSNGAEATWIETPLGKMLPVDLARATALKLVDESIFLDAIKSGQINHDAFNIVQNQYQTAYGDDLVANVMDVLSDADKNAFQSQIAAIPKTAQEDLLDHTKDMDKSYSLFDDWMKEGWDATKVETEAQINNYTAQFAEYARRFESLSPDEKKRLDDAFDKAIQLYSDSKTELAEDLWAAAITVVGVIPNPLTLAQIMLLAAGSRVAMKAGIEGSDYNSDPVNVLRDLSTGAAMGAFLKLTPGIINRVAPIVESAGGAAIKPISSLLEDTPLARTATSLAADLQTATPDIVKETARSAAETTGKVFNKQFVDAAESGYGGGFASGAIDQSFDWDSRKSTGENLGDILKAGEQSGEQALKTALLVHFAFRGFNLGKRIAAGIPELNGSLSTPKQTPRTVPLNDIHMEIGDRAIKIGGEGIVMQREASGAVKILSGQILNVDAAETPVTLVQTTTGKVPWAAIVGDTVKDFDQMSGSDQALIQQILQSAGHPISATE